MDINCDINNKSELLNNGSNELEYKEMEEKIIELQEEIEKKDGMLQNAASAGQQLVAENDNLYKKVKNLTKQLKDKQDEIDTYLRTNESLKITATRSGAEADDLHKKLIESHKIIENLREDNALLKSMNDEPKIIKTRQASDSFDKNTANNIITKLQHDKKILEQFYKEEQEKCSKLLENAEISARDTVNAKNENQELQKEVEQLKEKNFEINHNLQQEIDKYQESLNELEIENEKLRDELNETQQIVLDNNNGLKSPKPRLFRNASEQFSDDGLCAELEELGYYEEQSSNIKLAEHNLAEHDSADFSVQTPTKQFRKATIDAQEEFFRLTVIAAKIKYNDIPIATSTLWDKVKQENLSFHQVADWLNDYLSNERQKRNELQAKANRTTRITSITDVQMESSSSPATNSPSKQFFRKIKNFADTVTGFSSTLRLEVRFGRRVFEVKMKKTDKLETLLQTLPRIIGEDADSMILVKGKNTLNSTQTLIDLGLSNNDILRMIHRKKVQSYLRRYERKSRGNNNSIEMESEEIQEN